MTKLFHVIAALFVFTNISVAQVKWAVDPGHTNARFEVKHLGISFVDGQFKKLQGDVETSSATDFNNAKINFTIDVNSVDTRIEGRDKHLLADDFFNAEKFPTMTLKNGVLKGSNGKYTLTGDLTIRDVTKKVTFDVVQNGGIITDPWGKTRAGFTATTTINRLEYNVKYDSKLASGVDAVSPNVLITVNTELLQK